MEIRPVEAQLFHAETQAGMTKLTLDFRKFANAPRKDSFSQRKNSVKNEDYEKGIGNN
jgi:hypothetical protein